MVEDKDGKRFTVTEHVEARIVGGEFSLHKRWLNSDDIEIMEPDVKALKIVKEIQSDPA